MTTNTTLARGSRRALPDLGERARRQCRGDALLHGVGGAAGAVGGKGAAALGLSGVVDAKVMDRLYMEHIGPGGRAADPAAGQGEG